MIVTRPPRPADLEHVAANIRPMDRRECEEINQCDPLEGMRESVERSPWSAAVISRDELICIVGVAPHSNDLLSGCGMPWLIGIDGIEAHPRAFAVLTGPVIRRMEQEYPRLSNVVHSENELSIRWLERAGFTLGEPERVGRAMCLRFWKVRDGLDDNRSAGRGGPFNVRLRAVGLSG